MPQIGVSVGRVRVTRAVVTPTEAGYIKHMRGQADAIANALQAQINRIKGPVTASAILEALEPIEKKSQEYVPVDTGALKRSFFKEVRETVSGPKASIGYAKGGHPWYAALVHENLNFRHAKGKYAKFLERAVNEEKDNFFRNLVHIMSKKSGLKGR